MDPRSVRAPNSFSEVTESEAGVEATKELKLDAKSTPRVDVFPGNETVIQVTQVQQAVNPANALNSRYPNSTDAKGHRPFAVIDASLKFPDLKATLEELLKVMFLFIRRISHCSETSMPGKKECPANSSLHDVKSSIYATDEF
ncbi:hypothetical protein PVL29_008126 [Vitis rotundifolia]|uniref:Uncharacterized protein n=1 Tax=Vitis rotundifolia TaxID=103349 RepID=A0AA39A201_VITRO|nr:hypothetical protein PVL29_008126 [Vitis rotundifolia]